MFDFKEPMEFKSRGDKYDFDFFFLIPTIGCKLMTRLLQRRWGGTSWFLHKKLVPPLFLFTV